MKSLIIILILAMSQDTVLSAGVATPADSPTGEAVSIPFWAEGFPKHFENELYRVDIESLWFRQFKLIILDKTNGSKSKIDLNAWSIHDGFIKDRILFLVLNEGAPTRPEEDNWLFDLSAGRIMNQFHCTKSFPSPDKSWVVDIQEFGSNGSGPSQSDEISLIHLNNNKVERLVVNGKGEKAHPHIHCPEENSRLDAKKIAGANPSWYWKVLSDGLWADDSQSAWFVVGDIVYRKATPKHSSGLRFKKYLLIGLKIPTGNIKDVKSLSSELGLGVSLDVGEENLIVDDEFINTKSALSWAGKDEIEIFVDKLPFEKAKKIYKGKKLVVKLPPTD